jgi:NAD(P)-dependent dehydrogenase (short-subunit alcohol dehydrogenase family)
MSDIGYDGQVAIITGAGGGIGREHALMLAARGALVVVNDLGGAVDGSGSDAGAAERVVAEIKAAGGEAVADTNSVATPEGGAAIVQTAVEAFGRVDIVINNAGILRDAAFHKMTTDHVSAVLAVHLAGAFNVTQPAFVLMRAQGYGRIVSTSSASGLFGNFGQANYGAAKMGLVGLTRVLAVEGAKFNIKANAIAPLASTRMTIDLLGAMNDQVAPERVAPVVAYLASSECSVSGEIYAVGGPRVSRVFVAETQGVLLTANTPEAMRDQLDDIRNEDGYFVPADNAQEFMAYINAFKAAEA